jgi:hypothetical protein
MKYVVTNVLENPAAFIFNAEVTSFIKVEATVSSEKLITIYNRKS